MSLMGATQQFRSRLIGKIINIASFSVGDLENGREKVLFAGAGCVDTRQICKSSCICWAALARFSLDRLGQSVSSSHSLAVHYPLYLAAPSAAARIRDCSWH